MDPKWAKCFICDEFYTTSPIPYHHSYQLLLARENPCGWEKCHVTTFSAQFGMLQLFLLTKTSRRKQVTHSLNITSLSCHPQNSQLHTKELLQNISYLILLFKFVEYNCNNAESSSVKYELAIRNEGTGQAHDPSIKQMSLPCRPKKHTSVSTAFLHVRCSKQ
jgi:hypothetical protein